MSFVVWIVDWLAFVVIFFFFLVVLRRPFVTFQCDRSAVAHSPGINAIGQQWFDWTIQLNDDQFRSNGGKRSSGRDLVFRCCPLLSSAKYIKQCVILAHCYAVAATKISAKNPVEHTKLMPTQRIRFSHSNGRLRRSRHLAWSISWVNCPWSRARVHSIHGIRKFFLATIRLGLRYRSPIRHTCKCTQKKNPIKQKRWKKAYIRIEYLLNGNINRRIRMRRTGPAARCLLLNGTLNMTTYR